MERKCHFAFLFVFFLVGRALSIEPSRDMTINPQLRLANRVHEIRQANSKMLEAAGAEQWRAERPVLVEQLKEMLGLSPFPERTPLQAVVTGVLEETNFVVEKIHFQSRPGLYVTANLYRPKRTEGRMPTVLYVCGHGLVKEDGVSLGNKTNYRHHGIWLAQHGYVCMLIDTIQLGEIEGIHHGTYNLNRWDWPSRGYTPAGVEAWNAMRSIDYLLSRADVDPDRIGITGRSGGGAYSWYTAALDERIRVVVPVAGITDLEDHIMDRCVTGHCDCMYLLNQYAWDFSTLAALVAPRPLLIANTDRDPIFPVDGVFRIQQDVAAFYRKLGFEERFGIHWTTGGHQDTPELQIGCLIWLDQHLKGAAEPIRDSAIKGLQPKQLRVFDRLPIDERVTNVQDWFVPRASDEPLGETSKEKSRDQWIAFIRSTTEGQLPGTQSTQAAQFKEPPIFEKRSITSSKESQDAQGFERETISMSDRYGLAAQITLWKPAKMGQLKSVEIRLRNPGDPPSTLPINLGNTDSSDVIYCDCNVEAPEGIEPAERIESSRQASMAKLTSNQLRRAYILAGWTIEGRQIASLTSITQWLKQTYPETKLIFRGRGNNAMVGLHAAILSDVDMELLELVDLPSSYAEGFSLIGIMKRLDVPQVLRIAKEKVARIETSRSN